MRCRVSLVVVALVVTVAGCAPAPAPAFPAAERTAAATAVAEAEPSPAAVEQPDDQSGALEELVAEAQGSLQAIRDSSSGTYSAVELVAVPPSAVAYVFTYAAPTDPVGAGAYFDSMRPTLQGTADAQVFPAMTAVGIQSPSVTYTYLNPDGSLVWSATFDPS